jgi:hypothetical protein
MTEFLPDVQEKFKGYRNNLKGNAIDADRQTFYF